MRELDPPGDVNSVVVWLKWMKTNLSDQALLHDIGRALDPEDTTPHAFLGAEYLRGLGLERVANLVAFHSGSQKEANERCCSEPMGWVREATKLPSLLTYLDMTTGPSGEEMTAEERRTDIAARYGRDSFQVISFDSIAVEIVEGQAFAEICARG